MIVLLLLFQNLLAITVSWVLVIFCHLRITVVAHQCNPERPSEQMQWMARQELQIHLLHRSPACAKHCRAHLEDDLPCMYSIYRTLLSDRVRLVTKVVSSNS